MAGRRPQGVYKIGRTWAAMWDEPPGENGERRQRKKGGFATAAEAASHRADMLKQIEQGVYASPRRLTVDEFLTKQWLPSLHRVRPSTLRSYELHVRVHLVPALGGRKLQGLRPDHISRLWTTLLADGMSATTVHHIHSTLRAAMQDAMRWGLVMKNVASLTAPPPIARSEMNTWTRAEVEVFLSAVKEDRLVCLYLVLATTGMRRGEALGLHWRDVDLDSQRLAIREQYVESGKRLYFDAPKTKRPRAIALDTFTVEALRRHKARQAAEKLAAGPAYEDADLVFATEIGSPIRPSTVSARFQRLLAKHKLRRIRLHDLRHTFATLALELGEHVVVVSDRLGHSTTKLTADTYSHVTPTMQAGTAQRVADYIFTPPASGSDG